MEESTVFPPPVSPNKGDNAHEENVTNMAIVFVMLFFCICGLVGNLVVLWLLRSCQMRRNPITVYIFYQASTDFHFLLSLPSILQHMAQDAISFPILPEIFLMMNMPQSFFCYNMGLCLLTAISIERCRSILCPLWCCCHCPQNLSNVVDTLLTGIFVAFTVTLNPICMFLEDNHEDFQVFLISMYALNLILFAFSMVISSIILFAKVKYVSQQQQLKRLDIVIFLSVLFALPFSLCNLLQQLSYPIASSQVVLLLACIHSTIKPYLYFLVGSCWRNCSLGSLQLSLRKVFEEPEENSACSNDAAMDTAIPAS